MSRLSRPSRRADGRAADAGGYSLIELLIALMLLGIVVVGVVGLLGTLIVTGEQAKDQAAAEEYARSVVEDVKAQRFAGCDTGGVPLDPVPYSVTVPAPVGFTATVTKVEYGVAQYVSGQASVAYGASCGTSVTHRVTVEVGSPAGSSARAVVTKRRPCLLSKALPSGDCP